MPFYCFIAMESMTERLATSGITTLIGLGMTFVILALLIGTILLMRQILKEFEKIIQKRKKAPQQINEAVPASPAPEQKAEKEINKETYDAICTAVMNFTKTDDNVVIIKSVSRVTEKEIVEENKTPSTPSPATPVATNLPSDGKQIKAPMPGTLLKVVAADEKQVKEGEVIFVLEAMKMENDIVSPATGTIHVSVGEGAKVNTGDLLAVIK